MSKNSLYNSNYRYTWYYITATVFWIGRFPIMPGTLGSLIVYPIYYIIVSGSQSFSTATYHLYFCVVSIAILGYLAIDRFQRELKVIDHRSIVIDEVIGQLLVLAVSYKHLYYLTPRLFTILSKLDIDSYIFILAFILFRFFDIKKPFIIGFVDNFMRNTISVILDDVLAALFASITIYIMYITMV